MGRNRGVPGVPGRKEGGRGEVHFWEEGYRIVGEKLYIVYDRYFELKFANLFFREAQFP